MEKNTQIQLLEISRLMNYDRSKTLNEQDSSFTRNLDRIYSKPESAEKFNQEVGDFIEEYRHEILDVLAIGTLFIPVVGPFISLGIDIGNAALYYNEGDKEMAGLVAALSLIPGGELVRRIPGVKKYGIKFLTKALQKTKAGIPITKFEKEAIEGFIKNSDTLTKSMKKGLRSTFAHAVKKKLSKLSLKQKIGVLYNYAMTYPGAKFGSVLIQIGGITLSYFKLAEIFGFTNKSSDEEMIAKLTQSFKEDDEIVKDVVDSLMELPPEESNKAFAEFFELPIDTSSTNSSPMIELPQNIIDGVMKKGYLIRKGIHKQESKYPGMKKAIKFIQKIVGADDDGLFGPKTEIKVKEWQKSKGLEDDGIVGKNTLNKILKK